MTHRSKFTAVLLAIKLRHLIILYITLVGVAFIVTYLIDVQNLFSLRDFLESADLNHPRAWFHLFGERGYIELIQWFFLASLALTSMFFGARNIDTDAERLGRFWILMAIFFTILLVEDAGNTSHLYSEYAKRIFQDNSFLSSRRIVYVGYMILGSLPVLKYLKDLIQFPKAFIVLLLGYGTYGFAGIQSAFTYLNDFRYALGDDFVNQRFNGALYFEIPAGWSTEEAFADFVFEEPLELLAIFIFVYALVLFIQNSHSKR